MGVIGEDVWVEFACSGATTYPLGSSFIFLAETDLVVTRIEADGTEVLLVLNTDYTVSGGSLATGSVHTTATYSDGELIVYRDTPVVQSYDAEVGDGFDTDTMELQLDRITMIVQELKELQQRCLRIGLLRDSFDPLGDPSNKAEFGVIVNDAGNGFEYTPYRMEVYVATLIEAYLLGLEEFQASAVAVDTTNFDNNLSAAEDTVQKCLDVLDELVAAGTASGISVDTTNLDGNLSAADDTVQKALETIDEFDFPPSSHTHDSRYYTESEIDTLLAGLPEEVTSGTIASRPASASTGFFYLATDIGPTLFQWDGSAWKSIISYGAVDIYVDTTGTGNGYSSGTGAVDTIQAAIDLIPPVNGGDIVISVAGGSYTETLAITGKSFSGPYSLTVVGDLPTADDSGTATSASQLVMGSTGNGLQQATLVDTSKSWTSASVTQGTDGADYFCLIDHVSSTTNAPPAVGIRTTYLKYWSYAGSRGTAAAHSTAGVSYVSGEHKNKLLRITGGTGAGQERVIDYNTTNTLYLVGPWDTTPDATSTYEIVDLANGAKINPSAISGVNTIKVFGGQKEVNFKYICIDHPVPNYDVIYFVGGTSGAVESCKILADRAGVGSGIVFDSNSVASRIGENVVAATDVSTTYLFAGYKLAAAQAPISLSTLQNCKSVGMMQMGVMFIGATYMGYGGSAGNGLVCRNHWSYGMQSYAYCFWDLGYCLFTGSRTQGILNEGFTFLRSNNEVSYNGSNGILNRLGGIVYNATSQINYNALWGVESQTQAQLMNPTSFSYTGNGSGTYTP